MKKIFRLLLIVFSCLAMLCFCVEKKHNKSFMKTNYATQENLSNLIQEETTNGYTFELENFNGEVSNNDEGYLDISNEEFVKKVNQVTINTSYAELINIFAKSPYVVLETGVDKLVYFNDAYTLVITPGLGVYLLDNLGTTIWERQYGQSGDG